MEIKISTDWVFITKVSALVLKLFPNCNPTFPITFPSCFNFTSPFFSQSVDFVWHLLYMYLFYFICICVSMHFLKKTSAIFFSALCVWNTILRSEQCLWKPIKGRNVILASYWKVTQSTEKSRKPKEEINFYFYVRILPLIKQRKTAKNFWLLRNFFSAKGGGFPHFRYKAE